MTPFQLLCGNNSSTFSNYLLQNGGYRKTFPKGKDIVPYLKNTKTTLLVESGILVSNVQTDTEEDCYTFAIGAGTILPKFEGCFHCKGSAFEHFIPFQGSVSGILISSAKILHLSKNNVALSQAIERDSLSIISAMTLQTVLFRSGSGLSRICNTLYSLAVKEKSQWVLNLSQKNLSGFTGLSLSQTKRIITKLKDKGIIQTKTGAILIPDITKLKPFLSETFLTYPCFKHFI